MNILVLNCGSSSVKYKLINVDDKKTLAEGGVEKIGIPGSFLKFRLPDGSKKVIEEVIPDHRKAIMDILNILTDPTYGCISSFKEIDAVGHRVVHGGEKFNKSVLINDEVIEKIKECYDVAPLHNPVNMAGIDAMPCLTLLSIRRCLLKPICMHCPTSFTPNTVCVVSDSMVQAIVM